MWSPKQILLRPFRYVRKFIRCNNNIINTTFFYIIRKPVKKSVEGMYKKKVVFIVTEKGMFKNKKVVFIYIYSLYSLFLIARYHFILRLEYNILIEPIRVKMIV